jgi:hypothetical protein
MKVGELRLEKMERGVVCGYSKAEGSGKWTMWQRWRHWRERDGWELGCLWRRIVK